MPPETEAQRKAMASAAEGKSKLGIPAKVGKEFMDADDGGKLPARKEPEDRADALHKKGLISEKARDAAKAKAKSAAKVDEEIEGGPEIKPVKPAGKDDDKPKKGLALDDE